MMRGVLIVLMLASCVRADEWETAIGQTEQVTKGLVAYWAMRNSGTTVFDEFGANNGVASNGVRFSYADGAVRAGAWFDGTNDSVVVPNSDSLSVSSALTLNAWINRPAGNTNGVIVAKWGIGSDQSYGLRLDNANARLFVKTTNAISKTFSDILVPVNEWTMLSGVYDGSALRCYMNGSASTEEQPTGGSIAQSSKTVIMGFLDITGTPFFYSGNIDEVRIYNRALTADEIKQLYRMGALPKGIK
jgi:hypothetical protein